MDRLRFGLDAELDPYQLALAKQTNDNNINEKMCRYMLCLKYKHADGSLHALGSAFYVMHGQRLAVTAAHVTSAAGTNQIVACYPDGSQSDVITLGEDRIADISVIKVDAPCPLPTVRHTAPNVGDTVYFLGFSSASKLNFTKGMVTSMEQAAIFTTDAYADNGFSGGPVFNLHMELVGMVLGGAGITNQHVRCVHVAKVEGFVSGITAASSAVSIPRKLGSAGEVEMALLTALKL
eukprot:gene10995-18991_t